MDSVVGCSEWKKWPRMEPVGCHEAHEGHIFRDSGVLVDLFVLSGENPQERFKEG